jgi:hypothetical protein
LAIHQRQKLSAVSRVKHAPQFSIGYLRLSTATLHSTGTGIDKTNVTNIEFGVNDALRNFRLSALHIVHVQRSSPMLPQSLADVVWTHPSLRTVAPLVVQSSGGNTTLAFCGARRHQCCRLKLFDSDWRDLLPVVAELAA